LVGCCTAIDVGRSSTDLGRVVLKGLTDPIQAWQVLAASAGESRFAAQHETSLAPLVGRERELELLSRRWNQASLGEGRVGAELLFRRGSPPDAQYTFKHALVRDVAYASLLRANRHVTHLRH
jgi:hypothetical protein